MKYFEIKNASNPIQLGTSRFKAEPVILQSGSWIGVLALEDGVVSVKDFLVHPRVKRELIESEYNDLKKKRNEYWRPSESNVIRPEGDAEPAEEEKAEPENIEEVLMEGKADVKDPLSDKPKPKRRQPPKKPGKKAPAYKVNYDKPGKEK